MQAHGPADDIDRDELQKLQQEVISLLDSNYATVPFPFSDRLPQSSLNCHSLLLNVMIWHPHCGEVIVVGCVHVVDVMGDYQGASILCNNPQQHMRVQKRQMRCCSIRRVHALRRQRRQQVRNDA
jgi:hypothetical protein